MQSINDKFCTFFLDRFFFGVEVGCVQEVLRHQEMTRVPLTQSHIRGLINLRGQIVTAIDLRERLGFEPRQPGQLPMNVVVRTDEGAVSLLVDEIDEVVEVRDELFELPPQNLPATTRALIRGVYKFPKRLMLVLNTVEVMNSSAARLAAAEA